MENNIYSKTEIKSFIVAMLVIPIYMISMLIYGVPIIIDKLGGGGAQAIIAMIIIALGVSYYSIKCIFWLSNDRYRAISMGKHIFILFAILKVLDFIISDAPSSSEIFQWAGFINDLILLAFENLAIVGFLFVLAENLRGTKQHYTFAHFFNEITFYVYDKHADKYCWETNTVIKPDGTIRDDDEKVDHKKERDLLLDYPVFDSIKVCG